MQNTGKKEEGAWLMWFAVAILVLGFLAALGVYHIAK